MNRFTSSASSGSSTGSSNEYRHVNRNSRPQRKQLVMNENDFPSLGSSNNSNTSYSSIQNTSWQTTIKEREIEEEEQNKSYINETNSKYWRGVRWKGPMIIRKKPRSISLQESNTTSNTTSSIIVPKRGIEYSRDGVTWYNSWNDTFSEEQLYNIQLEEEREYQEECANILDDYRESGRIESERYYNETGELDGYALAELDRISYEEYAKQFDIQTLSNNGNLEDDEDEANNSDYLEDDN